MATRGETATVSSVPARGTRAPRTYWRDMVRSFRRNPAGMVGLALVVLFLLAAAWGAFGSPADMNRSRLADRLQPPGGAHLLGTDGFGRDILARVLGGAPLALAVGVVSVAGGGLVGCTLGLLAGYYRGKVGMVIMRVIDAMLAFPTLLLALAIMATLGPGLLNVMIAVGFSTLPRFARMMQAEVLAIGEREYVNAARAVGAPARAILLRHILPNAVSSVLVMATLYISTAILAEATLSFLGLGPRPPTPTWGSMINDGSSVLQNAPWVVLFPGLAITLTVLGFSLVGDGLRDALDTRLRER
ncbi:MAG TPA: ABC transporter permease [Thermomicrobiales bacterium]|nr:ABC transporter permease [Thermomicrobiales bacterium]